MEDVKFMPYRLIIVVFAERCVRRIVSRVENVPERYLCRSSEGILGKLTLKKLTRDYV